MSDDKNEGDNKAFSNVPFGKEVQFPGAKRPRRPISCIGKIDRAANLENRVIPESDSLYLNTTGNQSRSLVLEALTPENKIKFLELENQIEKIYAEGRDQLRREREEQIRKAGIEAAEKEAAEEEKRQEAAQAILDAQNFLEDFGGEVGTPETEDTTITGDGTGEKLPELVNSASGEHDPDLTDSPGAEEIPGAIVTVPAIPESEFVTDPKVAVTTSDDGETDVSLEDESDTFENDSESEAELNADTDEMNEALLAAMDADKDL